MKKIVTRLLMIGLITVAIAACRTAPVYNVVERDLGVRQGAQMSQISDAIRRAGAGLGWTIKEEGEGRLSGDLYLRTHHARVQITHDTRRFSIRYLDSANLNYSGSEIHSNYNGWVQNLEKAIIKQASTI